MARGKGKESSPGPRELNRSSVFLVRLSFVRSVRFVVPACLWKYANSFRIPAPQSFFFLSSARSKRSRQIQEISGGGDFAMLLDVYARY